MLRHLPGVLIKRCSPLFLACLSVMICLFPLTPVGSAQEVATLGREPNSIDVYSTIASQPLPPTDILTDAEPGFGFLALPDSPLPHLLIAAPVPVAQQAATLGLFYPGQLPPQETAHQNAPQQDAQPIDPHDSTLAQDNAEFGNFSINGVDVVDASNALQNLMPREVNLSAREVPIVDPTAFDYSKNSGVGEPYHWGGLLAQSLLFNVVENSFRAASDDQIRILLANKPFWHDWIASTKQFNMRRWNDGDDFLVNYVGHPLQGSVTGFIEIQNDPVGRQLRISSDREYWKSRFKAFLWATVYSTHSEISPDGEAGIGNEGGWTYPIKCKTPGCPQWNPRTMHSTNNTGWVDFTITPTVGTLWLLAEDFLDRYVSDRVQGGDRTNMLPMFLRGALNPARSMANLMRFQAPWYRDFQHDPEVEAAFVVRVQPSEEQLAELGPLRRLSIAPYFHSMPIGSPNQPCIMCFGGSGIGIAFDYALNRGMSLSFALEEQGGLLGKGSAAAGLTGSTASVQYGLRFMHESQHSILSLSVRPGLVIDQASMPLQYDIKRNMYYHPEVDIPRNAVTLQLSNDFKVTKAIAVRYSVEDTIVRYKEPIQDPPGIGKVPYLTWLSKDRYENKSNWSGEAGPVIRF